MKMPILPDFQINPLKSFDHERDRWILWLPVLFEVGISLHFSLRFEPPVWLGLSVVVSALIMALALWRWKTDQASRLISCLVVLAIVASGLTAAQLRTTAVQAPVLSKRTGPATVSGRVINVENFPTGSRVTLERPRISGLDPGLALEKARLKLRGPQPEITPGNWLRVRAILSPPSPPAAPGAFDFQRQSYFRSLGAVGFSLGPAKIVAGPEKAATGTEYSVDFFTLGLARLRQAVAVRVKAVILFRRWLECPLYPQKQT